MTDLPSVSATRLIRALQRAGFFVHHVTGGHYVLKHPDRGPLRVTLPWHNRDLKRGTLVSVIEQAGYTIEEFSKLL